MKMNSLWLLLIVILSSAIEGRSRKHNSVDMRALQRTVLATNMDMTEASSTQMDEQALAQREQLSPDDLDTASSEQSVEATNAMPPATQEAQPEPTLPAPSNNEMAITATQAPLSMVSQTERVAAQTTRIVPPATVGQGAYPTQVAPKQASIPAPNNPVNTQTKASEAVQSVASAGAMISHAMNPNEDPEVVDLLVKSNAGFDVDKKRMQVQNLVNRAITYLNDHTFDEACTAFVQGKSFVEGELYIFVQDYEGNVYANGNYYDMVWKNLWNLKDQFNTYVIQEIIRTAKEKRDWTTYYWYGATKVSYVKEVVKDGKPYAIGCGYYSHSKDDQVISLVKGAAALFNLLVNQQGFPAEEAFSSFSYPMGRFVFGDLYIYALDFQGMQVAHGERPGLIGTNAWNYQDAKGKYVNQEIIKKLRATTSGGIWIEYVSKGAPKLTYAEKVVDEKRKVEYFIACGYYPMVTRTQAVDLVKRGYEYMKRQGKSRAIEAFTSKRDDTFRYGDLSLYIYTPKGVDIADGSNPDLIGSNQWEWKDEDGNLYVQNIIKKGLEGGGWVNVKLRNSFESVYVEPIELGLEKYLIATAFFPISKKETALLLVKSAAGILKTTSEVEAMRYFTQPGSFMRGDLSITVYDGVGICLAHGENYDNIWRNMLDVKDDNGKPYVRLLINEVKRGPVQLTYTLRGGQKTVFAEQVIKGDKVYTVVSGYFN